MDLIEQLEVQRALSDAFDKLNTKKEAIYKQHNLNRTEHNTEESKKSWQYYEGYRDATMALLEHSISLGKPTQLELNLNV
tara:strand:+ start:103 stop:342 length:240 start_codon:yes stop_codon:yes gene_type:complete